VPDPEITIGKRYDDAGDPDGYRWRIGYDTGVLTAAGFNRVKAAVRDTILELEDEDRGYVLRDDYTEEQREAERIVEGAEHLYDIARTDDAERLEEEFRSYVDGVKPWPGITLDPDHIDYTALAERFRIKD
jgi:hypothetical protein